MLVKPNELPVTMNSMTYQHDEGPPLDLRMAPQHISEQNNQTCEIIVKTGEKFAIDLCLLTCHSGYFKWLFSNSPRDNRSPIVLDNVTATGFRAVLNYIQLGRVELSIDNIESILSACQYLVLTHLVSLCEQFLIGQLNSHWLQVFRTRKQISLFIVGSVLHDFLLENFEDISEDSNKFCQIPFEVLFSLAQSPQLRVPSEFFLFKRIAKWINYDFEERADLFDPFMTVVRLPVMSRDELEEVAMYFNPLVDTPALHMVNFLLNNMTT